MGKTSLDIDERRTDTPDLPSVTFKLPNSLQQELDCAVLRLAILVEQKTPAQAVPHGEPAPYPLVERRSQTGIGRILHQY